MSFLATGTLLKLALYGRVILPEYARQINPRRRLN
jgi:hypothetical protein